ncbi:MAG: DUF2235 domain-containing protein [Proteobacteria bacterium]|nr:DUF2235 domain-containing protein [Pseudomonadota bacterium]
MAYTLVFSDGTGQRGVREENGKAGKGATNIYRLYLAAMASPAGYACFYDPGLGADPLKPLDWVGWTQNQLGKATGLGISKNIADCYEHLILNDDPGRRLGLFGFSRGAYTVRSLGGLLGLCGVPSHDEQGGDIRASDEGAVKRRRKVIDRAIAIYQTEYGPEGRAKRRTLGDDFRRECGSRDVVPHVIGVFDTVAALGLPGIMDLFNPLKHHFHDAELNPRVPFGFQALAIDENRKVFSPDIWDERKTAPGQVIEQVWFPGVHSDIGGGYAEPALADVTLSWMIDRCSRPEIALDFSALGALAPSITGPQHDERTGLGVFWRKGLRGEKIRKCDPDRDPLAAHIEHRFSEPSLGYRPPALKGHPRVDHLY